MRQTATVVGVSECSAARLEPEGGGGSYIIQKNRCRRLFHVGLLYGTKRFRLEK